jgi:2-iminoacetate synthase
MKSDQSRDRTVSFLNELQQWPTSRVEALIAEARPGDVERAITRPERTLEDLAALLSPHAVPRLEVMAREAQRLTRWHFGRTIGLYVPLYLSNVCGADCSYCGYAVRSGNREKRVTLTPDAIRLECKALATYGFQSVLLLTGEAPKAVPLRYLEQAVRIAREYFPSVSAEIYSLDVDGYRQLCDAGLDGVTVYMETYDRADYAKVHLLGAKKNYEYRLDAVERAGHAGARRLTLGVLLGLSPWRVDVFRLALHARYLQKVCWQSAISVSFPRLRHVPKRFKIPHHVPEPELVQILLGLRLFLPEAGFNLSTRERAELRDRLIPLGVTMMSAGSSTRPGGYATSGPETLEQFEIEDHRNPAEVAETVRRAGYDPVWKDFDHAFNQTTSGNAREAASL